jgi:hypothetical protein
MEVDSTRRLKRGRPPNGAKRDSLSVCLPVLKVLLNITGWTYATLRGKLSGWEQKKIRAAACYAMVQNGASVQNVIDCLAIGRSTVRYSVTRAAQLYREDANFREVCQKLLTAGKPDKV